MDYRKKKENPPRNSNWRKLITHTKGVIVGTDQTTAWLLPWWWRHYNKHNSLPVTFVDFGLSPETISWCKERGSVLTLKNKGFVTPKEKIDKSLAEEWENLYGKNVWQAREGWFYKPFAMLLSPYETTLWIDLDCELCNSIEPIFDLLSKDDEISILKDPGREKIYNSGVVLFRKKNKLIEKWAKTCLTTNSQFIGDDYILSYLIEKENYKIKDLPSDYHWMAGLGMNPKATIIHWASNWGKLFIETTGGYQDYKESLLKNHLFTADTN